VNKFLILTLTVCLAVMLVIFLPAEASEFKYKEVKDFPTLSSFKSVASYETFYNDYIQDCLDNTYGGSAGLTCLIAPKLWDRELNIHYKALYAELNEEEKAMLKLSQKAWLNERDLSIQFNSMLLDKKYKEPGTMFLLMRSGEESDLIAPIIRQRALLLKNWLGKTCNNKDQENCAF